MKKTLIPALVLMSIFYSCGPAGEDRVRMDQMAKRTSDSIQKGLDSALNDPIKELGGALPSSAARNQAPAQPVATQPANTTSVAVDHK
jgi:hypothetical protein